MACGMIAWPALAAKPKALPSAGWCLPGLVNAHSHAFQRALLAAGAGRGGGDFWSWREAMYRIAHRLEPDLLADLAAWLYAEMLEAGYTWVGEFHYVHRRPDGQLYDPPHALAAALVEAARRAGIGLTLLPVLYRHGGFGRAPLASAQRRFFLELGEYRELLAALAAEEGPRLRLGIAFHSLRAVEPAEIAEVLSWPEALGRPIHIHIAEQPREVEDCLAHHGMRPVELLFRALAPDQRWTLVHAIHLSPGEIELLRKSSVTIAFCPSTEADLGDGLPPAAELFLPPPPDLGLAIGSDSQVRLSPWEELRWLEWGQRLRLGRRGLLTGEGAEALLRQAVLGGWRAAGFSGTDLDRPEDGVALSAAAADADTLADQLLFSGERGVVESVWSNGERLVEGGRHRDGAALRTAGLAALRQLLAG
jgi:formimidoylglutamate deiminase